MIIVTGATGKLGKLILERLLELAPPDGLGATARDPEKAADLTRRGVRVRRGDFADPSTLSSAFEGASQLLIVSSNAQAYGGYPLAQHRAAIDAARAAGVRRIVYTSHMAAGASSAFTPMHTHAATEEMLAGSGLAWTALRNGFYASTVPMLLGDAAQSGVLAAPADGKVAWTTHDDLAAAAAQILLQEGCFDGPTPPLTPAEALDLTDIAAILSELHGRKVERQVVTDDAQRQTLTARGLPQGAVATTLGIYQAARAGEFAAVDPTLAALVGRQPMTLQQVLASGADA